MVECPSRVRLGHSAALPGTSGVGSTADEFNAEADIQILKSQFRERADGFTHPLECLRSAVPDNEMPLLGAVYCTTRGQRPR